MVDEPDIEVLLDGGEDGGRKHTAYAAAVEGQNLKPIRCNFLGVLIQGHSVQKTSASHRLC